MTTRILFSTLLIYFLFSGCMETRYITEKYIKTKIENHKEGEFSSIKTFSIFKGKSYGSNSYLELTGYKYGSDKGLVIGGDKYYLDRQKFKGDQTIYAEITYIEISLKQCEDIISNFQILEDKIKAEKPKRNEEIYHDFSVSKDLFISFRKAKGSSTSSYIDFWIKGEKYTVSTYIIINKLNKFMDY